VPGNSNGNGTDKKIFTYLFIYKTESAFHCKTIENK